MTPSWLPLKICITGYPYAGKKTQAEFIAKRYGLDVFQMDELVQQAITFANENPEPFPDSDEHNVVQYTLEEEVSSDDAGWSEDEEQTFNLSE